MILARPLIQLNQMIKETCDSMGGSHCGIATVIVEI